MARRRRQMDSCILSVDEEKSLISLIGFETMSFSLLWRGSRDGFITETFHEFCDGRGPTLIVIKCTEGYIFGGYASISWNLSYKDCTELDSKAFLFSLTNRINVPVKLKNREPVELLGLSETQFGICGLSFTQWLEWEGLKGRNNIDGFEDPRDFLNAEQFRAADGNSLTFSRDRNYVIAEIEAFAVGPFQMDRKKWSKYTKGDFLKEEN